MSKELPHFNIGLSYGGNQEWFNGFMMRIGGCAAETVCDLCVYLDKYKGYKLYPFDINNLSKKDYIAFGDIIKPYLHPRMSGIDKLSIYIEGFSAYLADKNTNIKLEGIEGEQGVDFAKAALISQIDKDIPVPYLCLHHNDLTFREYKWHWFLLNAYKTVGDRLFVKAVTYSESEWLDFEKLWDTGCTPKGGMIVIKTDEKG